MKIGVIGSGSWGTSLSIVLNNHGHNLTIYGRNKEYIEEISKSRVSKKYLKNIHIDEKIKLTNNIEDVVFGKEIIVIAVASQAVRPVIEKIQKLVLPNQIILNLSKGIEISSLKTISQIVGEFLPENPFVALSGPSHAEEVVKNLPTTLVSASTDFKVAQLIQDQFSNDCLRIYTNSDVIGVEFGGSLKNIIALAAGICDGLGFGDNTKAALMTRGIKEISTLGEAMGASKDTFRGLSGIGDLIVTCTSVHSRNWKCGMLIGQGKSVEEAVAEVGMVVEGIYTIKSAYMLSENLGIDSPITNELYKVFYEGANPRDSVRKLMVREKKHEIENNNY